MVAVGHMVRTLLAIGLVGASLACADTTAPTPPRGYATTVYGIVSQEGQPVAAAFVSASVLRPGCLGSLVESFLSTRTAIDGRYALRLRVDTAGARCLLVNARRPDAPLLTTTALLSDLTFRVRDDEAVTDSTRVDLLLPSAAQ